MLEPKPYENMFMKRGKRAREKCNEINLNILWLCDSTHLYFQYEQQKETFDIKEPQAYLLNPQCIAYNKSREEYSMNPKKLKFQGPSSLAWAFLRS